MAKDIKPEDCQHEWKLYKQVIHADNDMYDYRYHNPHFKVRYCHKCKQRQYIDYVTTKT